MHARAPSPQPSTQQQQQQQHPKAIVQAQALPFGTPVKPEQLYTAAAAGDVPGVRAAVQRSWPSAAVLCEALAQACRGGHGDAMQVLLLHGAPIEPLTAQPSEAPLYSACQGGHLAVAKELLRRGASVDGVSAVHGDTALSCSAALGDPDLVSLLLAHHASLEATFAQGNFGSITPLARVTQAANTLDARLVPSALVDDGRGGGDETRRDDDTGADQSSTRWDACAQLLQDAARTRGGVSRIQQLWYVLRRAVHAWPYVRHWLVEHRAIIAAKEERRAEQERETKRQQQQQRELERQRGGRPDGQQMGLDEIRNALRQDRTRIIDAFRTLDKDGDGQVSKREFRAALPALGFRVSKTTADELFAELDEDGSGQISYDELNSQLRAGKDISLQPRLREGARGDIETEPKNAIPLRADPHDGPSARVTAEPESNESSAAPDLQMSLDDMRNALKRDRVRIIDAFRKLDKDGNRRVSQREFRAALPALGFKLDKQTAAALFSELDEDASGEITYDELNRMLRSGKDVSLKPQMREGARGSIETKAKNKIALREEARDAPAPKFDAPTASMPGGMAGGEEEHLEDLADDDADLVAAMLDVSASEADESSSGGRGGKKAVSVPMLPELPPPVIDEDDEPQTRPRETAEEASTLAGLSHITEEGDEKEGYSSSSSSGIE